MIARRRPLVCACDRRPNVCAAPPVLSRSFFLQARFEEWYAFTVDLSGTYYLQVVEWLYKQNRLATGHFIALGRRIDLLTLHLPIYLLAAVDDELIAPEQVFATACRVASPPASVRIVLAPSRHLGLFMGAVTLREVWPEIVRWLDDGEREPHRARRPGDEKDLVRRPAAEIYSAITLGL
jgi:poly(3-hydroxyalkanoate) synthetase